MAVLIALVLVAAVVGLGALVKGVLWLASVGLILMLVLGAVAVSRLRTPHRSSS